jgi:uncharacterized membrane protein YczE
LTADNLLVRFGRYFAGLLLTSVGIVMTIRAELGISPWDVLADGIRHQTPLTFGQAVAIISVLLVAVSWLFGIKPGIATLVNLLVVGASIDLLLSAGFAASLSGAPPWLQLAALLAGVAVIGLGAGLYIGAGFGAGPRDSLQLALSHRGGLDPGVARTITEGAALAIGAGLGGSVGVGTIVSVAAIGLAVRYSFRLLRVDPAGGRGV